jgi:hypothetical protein
MAPLIQIAHARHGQALVESRRDVAGGLAEVDLGRSPGAPLRFDGASWTTSGPRGRGIFGTDAESVWVVGLNESIHHFDGVEWAPSASGTERGLESVWAAQDGEAWAVGHFSTLLHFDGTSWSAVPTGKTAYLRSVWRSGPADVWVVGDRQTIVHWDGEAWQHLPVED